MFVWILNHSDWEPRRVFIAQLSVDHSQMRLQLLLLWQRSFIHLNDKHSQIKNVWSTFNTSPGSEKHFIINKYGINPFDEINIRANAIYQMENVFKSFNEWKSNQNENVYFKLVENENKWWKLRCIKSCVKGKNKYDSEKRWKFVCHPLAECMKLWWWKMYLNNFYLRFNIFHRNFIVFPSLLVSRNP